MLFEEESASGGTKVRDPVGRTQTSPQSLGANRTSTSIETTGAKRQIDGAHGVSVCKRTRNQESPLNPVVLSCGRVVTPELPPIRRRPRSRPVTNTTTKSKARPENLQILPPIRRAPRTIDTRGNSTMSIQKGVCDSAASDNQQPCDQSHRRFATALRERNVVDEIVLDTETNEVADRVPQECDASPPDVANSSVSLQDSLTGDSTELIDHNQHRGLQNAQFEQRKSNIGSRSCCVQSSNENEIDDDQRFYSALELASIDGNREFIVPSVDHMRFLRAEAINSMTSASEPMLPCCVCELDYCRSEINFEELTDDLLAVMCHSILLVSIHG